MVSWFRVSQVVLVVKNTPAIASRYKEMQVWSLGWEDPLEAGMATYSSILAWRIPMDRGAWWVTAYRVAKCRTWLKWLSMHATYLTTIDFTLKLHPYISCLEDVLSDFRETHKDILSSPVVSAKLWVPEVLSNHRLLCMLSSQGTT